MLKFMRILIFFDLPVKTKPQQTAANHFRNFLKSDGYHMIQYSVYARICNSNESVEMHRIRILTALPPKGSVRMMVITEKQYNAIEILLGKPKKVEELSVSLNQPTLF